MLRLDQHNTSSLTLSPRTDPRTRKRHGSSRVERSTSASLSNAADSGLDGVAGASQDVSHSSGTQPPQLASVRTGKRVISTPLQTRIGSSGPSDGVSTFVDNTSLFPDDNTASTSGAFTTNEDVEDDMLSDSSLASSSAATWTLTDRMRIWRNDALNQHLYTTAIFWGSKVFTKTRDPNDGFWLAQSYFAGGMFSRAERVLTSSWDMESEENMPQQAHTQAGAKQHSTGIGHVDQTQHTHPRQPLQPSSSGSEHATFAESQTSTLQTAPSTIRPTNANQLNGNGRHDADTACVRLIDISVACRYLAAQAMIRQEKWSNAMDILGEVNPFREQQKGKAAGDRSNSARGDGGIKFEASMCHLRGLVQLHLNSMDRAKECFIEALSIDVKCYESFDALVSGNMMDVQEEWAFIQGLQYAQQTPDDAEFIRMMYTIRLKKLAHREEIERCSNTLMNEYGLSNDADVLFGLADELYTSMRYADCFQITTKIMREHDSHAASLSLHLACMQHLPHLRSQLFLLAHELVDREPESVLSWYAVGLWYYVGQKWEEARRYFGKALLIDNRFGPAWISFAHSFALEGEHDQAITAYSTAQRHLQGSHLPIMFVGMQYILLSNIKAADEYLDAAYSMCQTDPLLLNEKGVAAYYNERYAEATDFFTRALHCAESVQSSPTAWSATHLNMGQAHHKLGNFDDAIACFERVLQLHPTSASAYSSLGLSHLMNGNSNAAIEALHRSLSLQPGEPTVTSILRIALQDALAQDANASTDALHFAQLSPIISQELDERVRRDEMEHYGRVLAINAGQNTGYRGHPAGDTRLESSEMTASGSGLSSTGRRMTRSSSRYSLRRQSAASRVAQEQNEIENEESFEESAVMDASQTSDMVD